MGNNKQLYKDITGKLWCDNMTAVNKYTQLKGNNPISMREANEDNSDIIQELRVVKAKLSQGVQCSWVKGHQSGGKIKQSRLNNIVDKIADTQHAVTGKFRSRNKTMLLPAQHAALKHKGTADKAKLDKRIQQFVWKDKLEQYFFNRLHIDPEQACNIDFESMTMYNKSLSKQPRCTRAKKNSDGAL